jgi:ketosteroid isomerase-like protein
MPFDKATVEKERIKMFNRKTFSILAATVLVGGLIGSANAAIVLEDSQAWDDDATSNAYPSTLLSGYDASAASKLVVTVSDEFGFGDSLISGVEFGGVAFELDSDATGANSIQQVYIFYLDATDVGGTFGTGDLVVTGSGSNDFAASFLALSGTADDFSDANVATSQSVTVDVASDGSFVVAAHANNNSGATAQSPLTPLLNGPAGSAGGGSGYAVVDEGLSQTFSFTGGSSRPVTTAMVFEPFVVPEPASLATGLFGMTLIIARRRKA